MKYAELIAETETELKELENKQKLVQFQKRVCFLWLLKTGAAETQEKAGGMVGWKLRQSQKIWRLYRLGGIKSVLHKNAGWQNGKLTNEQRQTLCQQLTQAEGAMSLATVQSQIETAFGVQYTIGGVSNLCQRLKIKLKTARPVNHKQDETKVTTYKKTLVS